MRTNKAYALLLGCPAPAVEIRDEGPRARYTAQAQAYAAHLTQQKHTPRPDFVALARASRVAQTALSGVDPTLPLVDHYTAMTMAREAAHQHPADRGCQFLAQQLHRRWEREPMGALRVGQIQAMAEHLGRSFGDRTAALALVRDELPRRGFHADLDVRRLAKLASGVTTQAEFEALCRREGWAGNRPDQVRTRHYVLALLERPDARTAAADPFEVDVNAQQPDQEDVPADGGKALTASLAERVLRGERVHAHGFSVHVDDLARVVLTTPSGHTRMASLGSVEAVVADFVHLGRAAGRQADVFEPSVNQQQPDAVRINVAEGGDVLGQDSETKPSTTNAIDPPEVNAQVPAQDQPGTSTGVAPGDLVHPKAGLRLTARLVCADCKHEVRLRLDRAPSWVAQPALWTRLASSVGPGSVDRLERAYTTACSRLEIRADRAAPGPDRTCPSCRKASLRLAEGTLGKDTEGNEPAVFTPALSGAQPSKPSNQPGTSTPNTDLGRDTEGNEPGVFNPGSIETSREGPTAARTAASHCATCGAAEGAKTAEMKCAQCGSTWNAREPVKQAAFHDLRPEDPVERYRAARAQRPSEELLRGIADPLGWTVRHTLDPAFARQAAAQGPALDGNPDRVRADLEQVGTGCTAEINGQYVYVFGFDPKFGLPHLRQVQAHLDACAEPGAWVAVRSAPDAEPGRLHVLVAERHAAEAVIPETTDPFEEKAASIRWALRGQHASPLARVRAERVAQEQGSSPAGMGPDYQGTVLNREGGAHTAGGMTVPEVPSAKPDEDGGKQNKDAGAENTPWVRAAGCLQRAGHAVSAETIAAWARANNVTYHSPELMAQRYADAHRIAAKISEGWGDGGAFERAVEADTAEDLWALHQGLSTGREPQWRRPQPTPVPAGAQAGTAGPGGAVPTDPPVDPTGQTRLPEPEPMTMQGQDMLPPEVRQAARIPIPAAAPSVPSRA
jgi:ssDNA-binding Zn-finger/Zn-ribbon topoisomerase 1